jgi:polyhydroxybutyrate depolymerase
MSQSARDHVRRALHLRRAITLALAASGLCCGGVPTAPSAATHKLVFNGVTRSYVLHVPYSFQPSVSALVVALHGAGDNGAGFQTSSRLSDKADQVGFAVVYPDGLFNSRLGATDWEYYGEDFSDDVGFLRQLINTLKADLHPDPTRIYVAGFSDGGRLAYRLGVELSDLVAAIGVISGSLFQDSRRPVPSALAPVSVLILHGDTDQYCGGPLNASQEETFNYWAGLKRTIVSPRTPPCHCATAKAT